MVILSPPRRKNSYGSSDSPVEGGRGTRYDDLLREAPHKRGTFKPQVHPVRVAVSRELTHLIQLPASGQHFMRRSPSILGRYVRDVLCLSGR